ncbi:AAA family ATPase [Terricaulis sp.]|uniref:AAA family ATPase n=1 Tax=Terricaulis sp. TaxID=2768686 RepID=UPI003783D23A
MADAIRGEINKAVIGQTDTVNLMLTSMLAGGHILLEGPPGTAKTLLAQCFAHTLDLQFGRIQFTPDLMPGDILGSNLFNFQTNSFTLTKGPIFSEILLADEINRTPPKTQAALLEAMQERRVTLDGKRHELSPRFTVIATQNPIEQQGAYPLPEAQLDRFLFKHVLAYPSEQEELRIVSEHGARMATQDPAQLGLRKLVNGEMLNAAVAAAGQTRLTEEVVRYIVRIVRATREGSAFELGASPRSAAMLAAGARAWAALEGRDYVIPDDVKLLATPALRHRVILSPAAEIEGRTTDSALKSILDQVEAPR